MAPHPTSTHGDLALSRRCFLGTAVACLATGMTVNAVAEPAPPRAIVGAHPWVYAATQPKYEIYPLLPDIFADMKAAGIEAIELMHTALRPPDAVQRIGELAEKHELPVIGTSFSGAMWDRARHAEVMADAELIIPRLAKLGGRTLGTSVGAAPQRKTERQLDDQAELLRKLMALCQEHGVVLNLHNHTYEVNDGMHDLLGTLKRIPEAKLGPDLNWLVRGGAVPVAFLQRFGRQIVFLHLRDQHADGRWSEALGEGAMDYKAIAAALKEINYSGPAIIELAHERDFTPTRPIRESLRISRQFVRQALGY